MRLFIINILILISFSGFAQKTNPDYKQKLRSTAIEVELFKPADDFIVYLDVNKYDHGESTKNNCETLWLPNYDYPKELLGWIDKVKKLTNRRTKTTWTGKYILKNGNFEPLNFEDVKKYELSEIYNNNEIIGGN